MPRFVNLPMATGNVASVRADRIEFVCHAYNTEFQIDETRSKVVTFSGESIPVALPKPRVMELLGLHLTGSGEEWV